MKKDAFLIMTLLLIGTGVLKGQTLQDFKYLGSEYSENTYLGIYPIYSFVANPEAPNAPAHSLAGFSGSLDMRRVSFTSGSKRYLYQHRLLFDMLLIVDNMINDDGSAYYRSESSGFTSGIIGWYSQAWNIICQQRFCLAAGVNLNDYFLGSSYKTDPNTNSMLSQEPQGYWFAGGPSLFIDYLISDQFLFQSHFSYSLGYWRAVSLSYAEVDDSYPNPHFGNLRIEVQSKWGVFAGMEHNFLINRGELPNKTRRTDLLFGFRFIL